MSSQKMSNKQLVLRIKAGENVADNMLQLWQQNQGLSDLLQRNMQLMRKLRI